jgi:hypothetical protein
MAATFIILVTIVTALIIISDIPFYTCGIEAKKEPMTAKDESKYDLMTFKNGSYI